MQQHDDDDDTMFYVLTGRHLSLIITLLRDQ